MWPWMWIFYAPTYRFPWGGDWQQSVDTNAATPWSSGNPELEHLIQTRIASYGRQIGWIHDVLLAEQPGADAAEQARAAQARAAMRKAGRRIEALKLAIDTEPADDAQARALAAALQLKALDPGAYAQLRQRLDAED